MRVGDIGISLRTFGRTWTPSQLEEGLAGLRAQGYRLVEVEPGPFALIVDGELRRQKLDGYLAAAKGSGLRFSVHGFGRLNLAFDPRHDLCKRIMRAQIELCGALGAARLVYHSGLQALDVVRCGARTTLLSDDELEEGARREVSAFKELAPVAADAGVVICMENLDPHLWEHNLVRSFGQPASAIDKHLARLRIGPIVRQLQAIDHPNVRMTLDVGHLYLSSHDRGFDYLEAVSEAAPWAQHLHVTDNFGRLDFGYDVEMDRWAYGEADLHMPPGWGSIPFADVFARLPRYTGDLILELEGGFDASGAEARAAIISVLSASHGAL